MRWLVFVVAALSLACLLAFADEAPRKKIVRRVLGWDSMRFRCCPDLFTEHCSRTF